MKCICLKHLYIFFIFIFSGCFQSSIQKKDTESTEREHKFIIKIDRNVETIGIIFSLTKQAQDILLRSNKSNDSYLLKLFRKKFSYLKDHPAVIKANNLIQAKILNIAMTYLGLHFSEVPEFKKISNYDDVFYINKKNNYKKIDSLLDDFADQIRIFYHDANLNTFFAHTKPFYDEILKEVTVSIPSYQFIDTLINIYQIKQHLKFIIIPSPTIFSQWGYSYSLKKQDTLSYFQFLSHSEERNLESLDKQIPTNGLGFNNSQYNFEFGIHEFGHSFIDFLSEKKYRLSLNHISYLNTEEIKNAMRIQGQDTSWNNIFDEHLVRAMEIVVLKKLGMHQIANKKLTEELKNGFKYLPQFMSEIILYDTHKKRFKDFESFFPLMIQHFSKINVNYPIMTL